MAYNIASNASTQQITNAVNYLLANFGSATNVNQVTGAITGPGNVIIAYLYKYLDVKYATSYDGSQGFSNSPTGATYYGLRNTNSNADDSNYADYVWYNTVGFGNTNFLYYIVTGGRSIQFAVASAPPDTGWVQATGYYIDLDVVTSGTTPVIQEGFVSYFTPGSFLVPRTGSPLAPVFTNITPALYSTNQGSVVQFSAGQTDTDVSFTNNTWRIGNSSTTGYADISKNNLTIGNPSLVATYAQWPQPTAMPNSPAFLTVPVRYKNSLGQVTQSNPVVLQFVYSDPGSQGPQGVGIDISGYTSFVQNSGGAFTPTSATLTGLLTNVTSPTYSWTISGATPTSATTASVVVTPTSSSTGVTATLTVTGTNISGSLSKTINLPVVYDGVPGQAGANGQMSAFPTIYIWTGSATPPTRPSTTSTYTWATGAYTAPSGWSTTAPSNTTAGNYLWSITVPLTVVATTTTSTLDWTNTSNAIRAIAYNGNNGTNGATGSSGSATFVVYRTANDSSAPTNAEVNAVIGRNPVAGDMVTVSYNNQNNATIYRYTTSWILATTYITGSLIVQNTITGDKIAANTITATNIAASSITGTQIAANTVTATNINSNGLVIKDNSGNPILGVGTNLSSSYINPASNWLNSNISINSDGTLSGAGSGAVSLSGLGAGSFATLSQITSANATTYIAGAAIGTAQVGVLTASNIGAGSIDATKINVSNLSAISANMGTITAGTLASGTIIAGQLSAATGTFAGSLTAATGTFSGSLSAATGTFAGNLQAAGGTFAGALSAATGSFGGSLSAATGTFAGTLSAADGSFKGSLTAATGTFAGNLQAAGGTFTGALSAATGTFAGNLQAAGGTFTGALSAATGTFGGTLTAADGSFKGSLTAATGTFAGALSAATGTFAGSLSAASGTFAGSLSAASGTFNGTLSVGSTPTQSGTGMSGSGAVFNNSGTFAIGNSTTNISFNNSSMYLNGNVVSTANVNLNAISSVVSATLNSPSQVIGFTNLSGVWPDNTRTIPVSVTITPTSSNSSILVNATSYFYTATHEYNVLEIWKVTSGTYTRLYYIGGAANVFDTSAQPYYGQIIAQNSEAATIVDTSVTAGVPTTYFLVLGNNASASVYAAFPSINVTELKR